MPRITHIELLNQAEQPALTIRTRTSVDRLPVLIGESYGKIAARLADLGELPAGTPYIVYYNMDMQNLDVEFGFPVASPLPGKDDVQPGVIPAGKRIFCIYRGQYPDMAPVYEEMSRWINEHGLTAAGTSYEYYYNSPTDFSMEDLLTRIVIPLR